MKMALDGLGTFFGRLAEKLFLPFCSIIIPETTKEMKKEEKNAHRLHKKVFDSLNSFWTTRKEQASGGMGWWNFLPNISGRRRSRLVEAGISPIIVCAKCIFPWRSSSVLLSVFLFVPIYHLYTHDDADETHIHGDYHCRFADNYMDETFFHCNRIWSPSSYRFSFFLHCT